MSLAFFVLWAASSYSQQVASTKGLSIGDQVPDIVFKNVENLSSSNNKLSDFRGKLVILDFWATFCGSCLAAMPKMAALQEKFGNQIQVLLVSDKESPLKINEFFKRYKNLEVKEAMRKLPMISDDSRWATYFPRRIVPHHVWIDPQGKIVAITDGYNTSEKNIADFLAGKPLTMQLKDDFLDTRYQGSLAGKAEPIFSSNFYEFIPNLRQMVAIDSAKNSYTRRYPNSSLLSMTNDFFFPYIKTSDTSVFYGYESHENRNRMIYKGNVLAGKVPPVDKNYYDVWKMKSYFVYEITVPLSSIDMVSEIGRRSLIEFARMRFNVEIKEEEIETECYVIKINNVNSFKSKTQQEGYTATDSLVKIAHKPFVNFYYIFNYLLENRTQPIVLPNEPSTSARFQRVLQETYRSAIGLPSKPVVFDTESRDGTFDFELKGNLRDYKELVVKLALRGITLTTEKRKVKYVVMRDLKE